VRIALDCHMSVKKLRPHLKHKVVYQAPKGVLDSIWIHDAWKKHRAEAIVSGDYDIGYWCEDLGMLPIWVTSWHFKRAPEKLAKFINDEIKRQQTRRRENDDT